MQAKTNYYIEFLKKYHEIRKDYSSTNLPKLLLHVCCGACSCYPLIFLTDLFDIAILFTNSNIYPESEYIKRFEALKKHVDFVNLACKSNIKIILDEYKHEDYFNDLSKYKNEKEGGIRCNLCIAKRMNQTFDYAYKHDFKFVTTVMTVSRNKSVEYINTLCKSLENKYPSLTYIPTDFKKNGGQDLGVLISKEEEIYRQDYCGCEFSFDNTFKSFK